MSIYLDHNATSPCDARVRAAMAPWLDERFGNASSRDHAWGWDAAEAVEDARSAVAELAGVLPRDVIFVSGATEAINTVLRGYVGFAGWEGKSIAVVTTEHDAVLAPVKMLAAETGVRVRMVAVDRQGHIDLGALAHEIAGGGTMVAVMAANNEIGTLHPVHAVGALVRSAGGSFLSDTAQAFGRQKVSMEQDGPDYAVISAHKIHGPKGIAALLARQSRGDAARPLIAGGGQERGWRGGTLNVPAIVGLGEACRLVSAELDRDIEHTARLRDRLEEGIRSQVTDVWVNGDIGRRLCNTSNMGFRHADARTLIRDMHDVAVSTGSACASGNRGTSHVLKAIGLSDEDASTCVRFSLGRFTTEAEIDYAIEKVVTSVHKLRRRKSLRS